MKWKLCCTAHINCTFLCLKEKFSDVIIWTVSFYQVESAKYWVLLEESLSFLGNLLYFLTLSYFGLEFSLKCPKKAWCTCIWKLGEKVPEKKTQWPNPRRNCPRRNCRRRKNILPILTYVLIMAKWRKETLVWFQLWGWRHIIIILLSHSGLKQKKHRSMAKKHGSWLSANNTVLWKLERLA